MKELVTFIMDHVASNFLRQRLIALSHQPRNQMVRSARFLFPITELLRVYDYHPASLVARLSEIAENGFYRLGHS